MDTSLTLIFRVEVVHGQIETDTPWVQSGVQAGSGASRAAAVEAAAPRAGGLPRDAASADERRADNDKRLDGANPFGDTLFTERNWGIVDVLRRIANEAGESSARIALAWVVGRPGVTSTLMGVSPADQVTDNVAALQVTLSAEHRAALDAVSAADGRMPYSLFTPAMRRQVVFGGRDVRG